MQYRILICEKSREELPTGEVWDAHFINCTLILEGLKNIFKNEGHDVTCVRGLRALQEQFSRHDCVLVHPSCEYIRSLQKLREQNSRVGLIITPGYESRDERAPYASFQEDCDGVYILTKPFSIESLLNSTERVIAAARAQSPSANM